ncbi:diguanylate cyclase/phosphodiesterase [Cryptosporangium aurantiacum]|uniref:Diguanylate cyclase/phosphodiesterase n=2 Tax=Cryptosporangium aurantiacum TaxID=134849 RepID=A0A1M7QT67_9ACTN|nr:diguanylate cyclase/phosphodiesterase [Cryptosporangium aurantiacum]
MDAVIGAQRLSLPSRLRALITGMTVLAAVCIAGVALTLPGPGTDWWAIPLVTVMVAISRLWIVRRYIGGSGILVDWGEAVLIVGLVLLPPAWTVLTAALGTAVAMAWKRFDPVKAWFNVATTIVGVSVAASVMVAIAGSQPDPISWRGALALTAMATISAVVSELACAGAVAFSRGDTYRAVVFDGAGTRTLGLLMNLAIGAMILAVARYAPYLLIVLPPVTWLLIEGFAGRVRTRIERRMWQRLSAATREMSHLDIDAVLRTAIVESAKLFSADVVEVEWKRANGDSVLTRGDAGGKIWQGKPGVYRPEQSAYPVSLMNGSGPSFGELRLCFRSQVRLPEREQLALASLGSALAGTMQNAYVHQQLHDLATQDTMTGLANRACLMAEGNAVLTSGHGTVALLLLDLDHFRQVNDTLGHEAGDELLRVVAGRLRAEAAPGETLARLHGDEFALLMPGQADLRAALAHARARGEALLGALGGGPLVVDGVELSVEATAGFVAAETGGCDMVELLRRADSAMYRAKAGGIQLLEFDAARDTASVDRLALASEMQAALAADDQIVIQLQPSIDLEAGVPLGAEVLVRWRHPRRGLLTPAAFIPDLEHTDLIAPLTRRVFELALGTYRAWLEDGVDAPVAVNLSARSLLDRDLPEEVGRLLAEFDVPPDRLVLEITETAMMSELEVVDEVLTALRELGVRLSLDDFGTGFSSLTSVARVTVDEIKIDRQFVIAMGSSRQAEAVVRMTVGLAQTLGLRAIAEGVETAQQRTELIKLGCHGAQGFFFYPPLDPDEAKTVLAGRGPGHPN